MANLEAAGGQSKWHCHKDGVARGYEAQGCKAHGHRASSHGLFLLVLSGLLRSIIVLSAFAAESPRAFNAWASAPATMQMAVKNSKL